MPDSPTSSGSAQSTGALLQQLLPLLLGGGQGAGGGTLLQLILLNDPRIKAVLEKGSDADKVSPPDTSKDDKNTAEIRTTYYAMYGADIPAENLAQLRATLSQSHDGRDFIGPGKQFNSIRDWMVYMGSTDPRSATQAQIYAQAKTKNKQDAAQVLQLIDQLSAPAAAASSGMLSNCDAPGLTLAARQVCLQEKNAEFARRAGIAGLQEQGYRTALGTQQNFYGHTVPAGVYQQAQLFSPSTFGLVGYQPRPPWLSIASTLAGLGLTAAGVPGGPNLISSGLGGLLGQQQGNISGGGQGGGGFNWGSIFNWLFHRPGPGSGSDTGSESGGWSGGF